ncbi:fam11a b protein [Anaeramoeba ignava]|uniref:Fam11a b protein n=1 Tax=Anaeramoeba ignava TaxID=1746090 RepID=A0A9Q0LFL4_ANAIG|nr:fam11a b protein [Anaeramoeba ignava]
MDFFLFFFSLTSLLTSIFATLRMDDKISWTWTQIFIPLWIFDIFFLYTLLVAFLRGFFGLRNYKQSITFFQHYIFTFIPLLAFQVLLVRKIDGLSYYSYISVFSPLIVLGIIWIFGFLSDAKFDSY